MNQRANQGIYESQRRKDCLIKAGYIPRPKGRPRKQSIDERTALQNEVIELRMKVDVLRNWECIIVCVKAKIVDVFQACFRRSLGGRSNHGKTQNDSHSGG